MFEVNDWVYLKVSPMKDIMKFGKKGSSVPDTFVLTRYLRELAM